MILGALLASGLSEGELRTDLGALPVDGWELAVHKINKKGFAATKVDVTVTAPQPHRHLRDIAKLIDQAQLPPSIKSRSMRIFERLAEAEAAVHGTTPDKIHFHEVGAVDAIVDIVGAVAGIHRLGLERIVCSPIPAGSGTVKCEHGTLPVPAPATVALLVGVPLAEGDEPGELTTPTGAAVLTTLADAYGPVPPMRIARSGFGAGSREGRHRPNLLRILVGESLDPSYAGAPEDDEVLVLETNLDDATGEQVGHAFDALFDAGALDVFATPVTMKKNRPGVQISVIVAEPEAANCEDVLFRETTTFGVRRHRCTRRKLARESEPVHTRFGTIRLKIGRRGGRVVIASPEYDDCAQASRDSGVALRDVMFEAERLWRAKHEAEH